LSHSIIKQAEDLPRSLQETDFDPQHWQRQASTEILDGGRGGSWRIDLDGEAAVLRRYLRGGVMAGLLGDRYLWTGERHSRPWREWRAVRHAVGHGLPTPPLLGYRIRPGGLFYRAELISRFQPNLGTLATVIESGALDAGDWRELGGLIRRYHQAGICHADLNANNILLGEDGDFHLIDFDKAELSPMRRGWREANLSRLRRSLCKISRLMQQDGRFFHFNEDDWAALLEGYR
jgi:3-deoxy-D-manno-octulosonic acid kinase